MTDDTLPPKDDARLKSLDYSAAKAFAEQNYEQAADLFRIVLRLKRQLLPPGHPDLGIVHMDLVRTLLWHGEPDCAYRHAAAALEIFQGHHGPSHISLVGPLSALAEAFCKTGANEDAVASMRRAIEILENDFGRDHMALASPLLMYAKILRRAGDGAASIEVERRGHRIYAANENHL